MAVIAALMIISCGSEKSKSKTDDDTVLTDKETTESDSDSVVPTDKETAESDNDTVEPIDKDTTETDNDSVEPADKNTTEPDSDSVEPIDKDTAESDNDTEKPDSDIPTSNTTYNFCTGQNKCYNNSEEITCPSEGADFYGQDAEYSDLCIPKNYTANSETVTDNNTNLIWQRNLPSTYSGCTKGSPAGSQCSWQEAINYCDNLTLAGNSNWRLPNIEELETLINYGRYNPSIDTTIFPNTPGNYFWSSSPYVGYSDYAWDVYFGYGSVYSYYKTDSYYFRCVSGNEYKPAGSFTEETKNSKVIVTDSKTNLQWTKECVSGKTWQQALSYCETLDYGSYTDWRLPNINELKTLINRNRYNPVSDFPDFPGMPLNYFWSSSSNVNNTNGAWYVYYGVGVVDSDDKAGSGYVRCVR